LFGRCGLAKYKKDAGTTGGDIGQCEGAIGVADRSKLDSLSKTKKRLEKLLNAEIRLQEFCRKLKDHLDTASLPEKREILDMLAIKVTATTETISIEGVIPLETTPPRLI
jgi:hypothetical protein